VGSEVSQEPVGCTLQAEECIALCRREVQAIAATCRALGQKHHDVDFPPEVQSLYGVDHVDSVVKHDQSAQGMAFDWQRASEGALATASTAGVDTAVEVVVPGHFGGMHLLGALAALPTVGKEPWDLIVCREPDVGVFGVRLYLDGVWTWEILDDFLPVGADGQPACSHVLNSSEYHDWPALVEKAYAKVLGSYAALAQVTELEALQDVMGNVSRHISLGDFQIWGELWQHLRSRRRRGCAQVAVRRVEMAGEVLTSGLVSGFVYPVARLELVDGEMLCELLNPWSVGSWTGSRLNLGERKLGPHEEGQQQRLRGTCRTSRNRSFWMSIQDFCRNFTDVFETRLVPAHWHTVAAVASSERPSYPLVSVSAATQAIFEVTQSSHRWSTGTGDDTAGIGLRIYRCPIIAPPQNAVGVRQNVSSPFGNLELIAEQPPLRHHSFAIELAHLEPSSLYIASIDTDNLCNYTALRVFVGSAPRFRQLSAPETSYFLQAQSTAIAAINNDSVSSFESINMHGHSGGNHLREMPVDLLHGHVIDGQDGWREWPTDEAEGIKIPPFLQACITSCSG